LTKNESWCKNLISIPNSYISALIWKKKYLKKNVLLFFLPPEEYFKGYLNNLIEALYTYVQFEV